MKFPEYKYRIEDEKYNARTDLFKYMIGIYTALIAASLFGFEKSTTILHISLSPANPAILYLKKSIIALIISIIHALLILVLSYHHKYYSGVYLEKHRADYEKITNNGLRTLFGWYVYCEHIWAKITAVILKLIAATWFIFPLIALYFLTIAFQCVFV